MSNRNGFTLVEITIVLLIIGLLAQFGFPRFFSNKQTQEEKFISSLNALVQESIRTAIDSQVIQKVFINLLTQEIELLPIGSNKPTKVLNVPKEIEISDIYINNASVFTSGGKRLNAYFFINIDGVAQHVKLDLINLESNFGVESFLLNPFTGRFIKQ